jgi:hypothetical protein
MSSLPLGEQAAVVGDAQVEVRRAGLAVSGADPAAASFATPAAARTEPAAAEAINVRRETVTTVPSDPSGKAELMFMTMHTLALQDH